MKLGDCCVDFYSLCLNVTSEEEIVKLIAQALYGFGHAGNGSDVTTGSDNEDAEGLEVNATTLIKSYGSCVLTPTGERFTMITSCPAATSSSTSDVTHACAEADKYPNRQPYSVSTYMTLTFRNLDCAHCHGYKDAILTPWLMGVSCKYLDENRTVEEILAALRAGNCTYVYR
jgi:hypothetical protein